MATASVFLEEHQNNYSTHNLRGRAQGTREREVLKKKKSFLDAHKLLSQPVLSGREAAPESRCSLLVFSAAAARLKQTKRRPVGGWGGAGAGITPSSFPRLFLSLGLLDRGNEARNRLNSRKTKEEKKSLALISARRPISQSQGSSS